MGVTGGAPELRLRQQVHVRPCGKLHAEVRVAGQLMGMLDPLQHFTVFRRISRCLVHFIVFWSFAPKDLEKEGAGASRDTYSENKPQTNTPQNSSCTSVLVHICCKASPRKRQTS